MTCATRKGQNDGSFNDDIVRRKKIQRELHVLKGAGQEFGADLAFFGRNVFVSYVQKAKFVSRKILNTNTKMDDVTSEINLQECHSLKDLQELTEFNNNDNIEKPRSLHKYASKVKSKIKDNVKSNSEAATVIASRHFNPVKESDDNDLTYTLTPAYSAGLSFGDRIVRINSQSVEYFTNKQVAEILKKESTLRLTIEESDYVTLMHKNVQQEDVKDYENQYHYEQQREPQQQQQQQHKIGNYTKKQVRAKPDFLRDNGFDYQDHKIQSIHINNPYYEELTSTRIIGINGMSLLNYSTEEIRYICQQLWLQGDVCITVINSKLGEILLGVIKKQNIPKWNLERIVFVDTPRRIIYDFKHRKLHKNDYMSEPLNGPQSYPIQVLMLDKKKQKRPKVKC